MACSGGRAGVSGPSGRTAGREKGTSAAKIVRRRDFFRGAGNSAGNCAASARMRGSSALCRRHSALAAANFGHNYMSVA